MSSRDFEGLRRYAIALVGMARPDQLALVCVVYALGVLVAVARGAAQANVLLGLGALLPVGVAYSLGPRLAWRGLGEVTNALLGGLVLPLYGIAVVGVVPDLVDVLTFLPFTAIVFTNLLATQWPDRRADEHVGKRTLAVELDATTLRVLYVVAAVLGLTGLVALVATPLVPWALAALAAPTALLLAIGARRYGHVESPAITVHAMVALAFAHVLVAACLW